MLAFTSHNFEIRLQQRHLQCAKQNESVVAHCWHDLFVGMTYLLAWPICWHDLFIGMTYLLAWPIYWLEPDSSSACSVSLHCIF